MNLYEVTLMNRVGGCSASSDGRDQTGRRYLLTVLHFLRSYGKKM